MNLTSVCNELDMVVMNLTSFVMNLTWIKIELFRDKGQLIDRNLINQEQV